MLAGAMPSYPRMSILETERLRIRPFVPGDLDRVHQLLDVELDWSGTIEERSEWLAFVIRQAEKLPNPPQGYRAIERRSDGRLIGKCGFFAYVLNPAELRLYAEPSTPAGAEAQVSRLVLGLGYGLERAARGSGFASEAIRRLIRFAFEDLEIDSVWARTMRSNAHSLALMQRVGMRTGLNPDPDPDAWPGALGMIRNPALAGA
jgi:ribosomal-protein-alanine N-acetyltransferase